MVLYYQEGTVRHVRTLAPPPTTHWRAASWDSVYSRRDDEEPHDLQQRDYRDDWNGSYAPQPHRDLESSGHWGRGVGDRGGRGWGGSATKMDFTQVVGAAMRQELGVRERRG